MSVVPEGESFTSCALPPALKVKGMCFCMMGNILDVGAGGTFQGGDVGAVGTVVQKDVWAFDTVDPKDVVAAGSVRKCWFCSEKGSISAVSHQSSVISPGLKVGDPVL